MKTYFNTSDMFICLSLEAPLEFVVSLTYKSKQSTKNYVIK